MLLKLMEDDTLFSQAELVVRDYLLRKQDSIESKTATEIALENHVSKSTLTRFSKKMGFSGWQPFKKEFLNQIKRQNNAIRQVDTNFPFLQSDAANTVIKKVATLKQEIIEDTRSLLKPEVLSTVVELIKKQKQIHIFAEGYSLLSSLDFSSRMVRTGKMVTIDNNSGMEYIARCMTKDDLAILVSYSGGTKSVLNVVPILKKNGTPIVSITSDAPNPLYKISNYQLFVPDHENLYSKISNFSADDSIRYIFDVIFSLYFSLDYDKNLREREELAKLINKKYTPDQL